MSDTDWPRDQMYRIHEPDSKRAVIQMAGTCDYPWTSDDRSAWYDVVDRKTLVAVDFSRCTFVGSAWLRLVNLLYLRAKRAGGVCVAVAMDAAALEKTEELQLGNIPRAVTLEKAWEQ
jgi:hypothetical protein